MQSFLFVLSVLLAITYSSNGLRCYVCNSNDEPDCSSSRTLSRFAVDCNITVEPYCRLLIQTVDLQNSIVRACGSKVGSSLCFETTGSNKANVCSCNTDLCNHVDHMYPSIVIILANFFIFYFIFS